MDTPTDLLPILVKTEDGRVRAGMTEADLEALLNRLGSTDDHFAVVERARIEDNVFIQVWRGEDRSYAVEHRDGSPQQHFTLRLTDLAEVTALFTSWALGDEAWRSADWQQLDLTSIRDLDEQTRTAAENHARLLIHCGFAGFDETALAVSEYFDPKIQEVTVAQARRIITWPWEERLREQESWPEVTDPDRLAGAFAALEAGGITARMDFACCGNCAGTEIAAEAAEGDRGYVWFHHQDTERVAETGVLWLSFGAYPGSVDTSAHIGAGIVTALKEAGLPVEWDGSPDGSIKVHPLEWLKRLPQ